MNLTLRPKALRSLAVLALASLALTLGACGGPVGGGGGQESQSQDQGGGSDLTIKRDETRTSI